MLVWTVAVLNVVSENLLWGLYLYWDAKTKKLRRYGE